MSNSFGSYPTEPVPAIGHLSQFRCEIVRLTLQETGTYEDQYSRAYRTSMREENMINEIYRIVEQTNYAPVSGAFDNLAGDILTIAPRVTPHDSILIPNGWGTQRCRFFLEVRETSIGLGSSVYHTVVQGFTDYMGVNTHTSSIDPNLRLFPNTFFRFQEYMESTPHGPRKAHRVVSSGQVLNGYLTIQAESNNTTQFLRPCDVLAGVQRKNDEDLISSKVVDFRNQNVGGFNTVYSSFTNNNPSDYLSRLVTPLARGSLTVGFGAGHTNMIDTAVTNAMSLEPDASSSPFMQTLITQIGPTAQSCLTIKDLQGLDPTMGQRTTYIPVATNFRGLLAQRGTSADWQAPTHETVVAAKIMNTLPGLMWEHFVGMVSFSMTNEFGEPVVSFDNMRHISEAVPRGMAERFIHLLQHRLSRDVTMNNQLRVRLSVNASILGDVTINVSVNGQENTLYQAPAFGNGVLNPVYARSKVGYDNMIEGMMSLAAMVDQDTRNSASGIGNIKHVL